MRYQHMPNYQPSNSYEHFNDPRSYRIVGDISSYEQLTFANMDQPVE